MNLLTQWSFTAFAALLFAAGVAAALWDRWRTERRRARRYVRRVR